MRLFTGNVLLDLTGLIVAMFAIIYAYFQWLYQYWERKGIPYMDSKFPYDNREALSEPITFVQLIFKMVQKAKKQGWKYFGMFRTGKPFFVPLDLELIKCILTKDFSHFTDRGFYYNEKDDPLSAHLFAIDGIKWRNLRTKLSPTFTSGKMRGMFQTLADCSLLLEKIAKEHDSSEPIDIKHMLVCFSTDIIGSCAFGLECNSFKDQESPFLKYGRKIFEKNRVQQFIDNVSSTFPNISRTLHVKTIPQDVTDFFFDVVTKTVTYRKKNNIIRNDFLQILIDLKNVEDHPVENKGNGTNLSMEEIVAQCFVFFIAGFETSSTTMTFALFELATHPEIQEKVRKELLELLKKHDNNISYDFLKELTYMQQVIDETLRKYPPSPFITRQCVEDYKVPNSDVTIEKGIVALIPLQGIHYDEDIYKNPEVFDPERFNDKNKQGRHQYAFLPFGEGPRICIGMRFALMQSKVGLATILKNFRITLSSKTKTPLEMDPRSFVPTTKGGVWLNLEKI